MWGYSSCQLNAPMCGSQQLRCAAARPLLIVAGECQAEIVRVGALPLLVALLCKGSPAVKLTAARALRNLAANNDENKVAIVAAGALAPLLLLTRAAIMKVRHYQREPLERDHHPRVLTHAPHVCAHARRPCRRSRLRCRCRR